MCSREQDAIHPASQADVAGTCPGTALPHQHSMDDLCPAQSGVSALDVPFGKLTIELHIGKWADLFPLRSA